MHKSSFATVLVGVRKKQEDYSQSSYRYFFRISLSKLQGAEKKLKMHKEEIIVMSLLSLLDCSDGQNNAYVVWLNDELCLLFDKYKFVKNKKTQNIFKNHEIAIKLTLAGDHLILDFLYSSSRYIQSAVCTFCRSYEKSLKRFIRASACPVMR